MICMIMSYSAKDIFNSVKGISSETMGSSLIKCYPIETWWLTYASVNCFFAAKPLPQPVMTL